MVARPSKHKELLEFGPLGTYELFNGYHLSRMVLHLTKSFLALTYYSMVKFVTVNKKELFFYIVNTFWIDIILNDIV